METEGTEGGCLRRPLLLPSPALLVSSSAVGLGITAWCPKVHPSVDTHQQILLEEEEGEGDASRWGMNYLRGKKGEGDSGVLHLMS